jgi:hypothetical protein
MAKEGPSAKQSSGWALWRRNWIRVQSGGLWPVKPSGARQYVGGRYSGPQEIARPRTSLSGPGEAPPFLILSDQEHLPGRHPPAAPRGKGGECLGDRLRRGVQQPLLLCGILPGAFGLFAERIRKKDECFQGNSLRIADRPWFFPPLSRHRVIQAYAHRPPGQRKEADRDDESNRPRDPLSLRLDAHPLLQRDRGRPHS